VCKRFPVISFYKRISAMARYGDKLGSKNSPLKEAFFEAAIGVGAFGIGSAGLNYFLNDPMLAGIIFGTGVAMTFGRADKTYQYEKKIREYGAEGISRSDNNDPSNGPS
jgi:hypothetical protein